MTFEAWLREVDTEMVKICFLTHLDLADAPYRDMFSSGTSPKEAAKTALVDYNDYPEELVGD